MKTGYLECFAGVSGDMMLGALIDAGVSRNLLEQTANSLKLGVALRFTRVSRSGISASKVDVLVDGAPGYAVGEAPGPPAGHSHEHPHEHSHKHSHDPDGNTHADPEHSHHHGRSLPEIRSLILGADLPAEATALALRTFELLAQSESKIHDTSSDAIHFHEVGAVDAIIDIVCGTVGLCSLGVDNWVCSALNVGGGFVDCAHGRFPVPAPATADLLRGTPTYSSGIQMELVTPTGAALVRALGCTFGDAPHMRIAAIGYGAGTRDPERFPNVLRLSVGESVNSHPGRFRTETISVLECAVDDMNPQIVANTAQLALERGALDVMCTSVVMKKGRLGTLMTLLCRPDRALEFQDLLFRETSTLGVRIRHEERAHLDREIVVVETRFGAVAVKVAASCGEQFNAHPEYEDCRRLAATSGVALKDIIEAAMIAFAETSAPKPFVVPA